MLLISRRAASYRPLGRIIHVITFDCEPSAPGDVMHSEKSGVQLSREYDLDVILAFQNLELLAFEGIAIDTKTGAFGT